MTRPSRRVRQRLVRKFRLDSVRVKQVEQARNEAKTVSRLSELVAERLFLYRNGRSSPSSSYGKMAASNGMLSSDNLSAASHTIPGAFDGQLRLRGELRLDGKRHKPEGLGALIVTATLEAAYDGETPRREWMIEHGAKIVRFFGLELYVIGEDKSRSIRARNSGSGKPKRKSSPPRFGTPSEIDNISYRKLKTTKKKVIYQETGIPSGRTLTLKREPAKKPI